ncbi:MAG: DUF3460 family protein [Lautropia sp.]|nr:MAG: DUF3460 family protein [Pseudomonadota bacterium]MBC6959199.1 DUF3460 family protein [Lautropia sp.]MCL4701502.1 DUF3460 family protein [Burkholderiaceae bacterium]MDL1907321.1 DUF3460 family protein [Betaproteobacteria bacterium PRO1]MEB2335580.1 DUF3460 family protein [Burkholderiales bacterium]
MYESEITRFIAELKRKNPRLEASQREGRALLWDRPQDAGATRRYRESRVAQQPYVYYPKDYT